MQVPLQITFRHMDSSDAVAARIHQRAEELERFFDRIISCRVVVECQHPRHQQGNLFRVRVDLKVPGNEIVVGRDPEAERIWDRARDASVDSMIGVLGLGPATLASDALRGLLRSCAAFAETATREWLEHKRFTREQMHALLTSTLAGLVAEVLPLIEQKENAVT